MRIAQYVGHLGHHDRTQAQIAIKNGLLNAFPALEKKPQTLNDWTQRHLNMLARESMDAFCFPRINASNINQTIHLQGHDILTQTQRDGQGVILILNHYSRLILLLVKLGMMGTRINMLTMRIDHNNPELSPTMQRFLKMKVERLLGFIGGEWLSIGDNLRPIIEGLKRGEIWVVLADAYMPHFDDWREYPFLGGQLRISRGIERMATKTGARLIYGMTRETSPTNLVCELRALPSNVEDALSSAVKELEHDVLAAPWEWWQWNILDYLWTPPTK